MIYTFLSHGRNFRLDDGSQYSIIEIGRPPRKTDCCDRYVHEDTRFECTDNRRYVWLFHTYEMPDKGLHEYVAKCGDKRVEGDSFDDALGKLLGVE